MVKELSLEGKTALITGGSSGIGKAIALVFAEAGADVELCARGLDRLQEAADEVRTLGRKVFTIQADVSDRQQVDDLVAKATSDLGRIDILVNNAGGSGGGAPVIPLPDPPDRPPLSYANPRDHTLGLSDEKWQGVLDGNLSSCFYCCRAIGPQMLERRSGKVINITSTGAFEALPYNMAYHSAKAGMQMFTKVLANEWAPYSVNVNGIAPGWFLTASTTPRFEDPEYADWARAQVEKLPMRYIAPNRDCGLLALYLASEASQYMTGQLITLDGGDTATYNR